MWREAPSVETSTPRLEPVSLDGFAAIILLARGGWQPSGPLLGWLLLPNLADVIQEKCEKLLEQVCMPVQG